MTAPDYLVIGDLMLMVKIAAARGAQRQEHLGSKRCEILMMVPLAEERIR